MVGSAADCRWPRCQLRANRGIGAIDCVWFRADNGRFTPADAPATAVSLRPGTLSETVFSFPAVPHFYPRLIEAIPERPQVSAGIFVPVDSANGHGAPISRAGGAYDAEHRQGLLQSLNPLSPTSGIQKYSINGGE